MASESIGNLRKRRGALRRSLNKLASNVRDLEEDRGREDAAARAKLLLDSLDRLDSDFKGLHFKVIDLVEEGDEGTLDKEQEHIDKHDDDVTLLRLRLQPLLTAPAPKHDASAPSTAYKTLSRKLSHLEKNLHATSEGLNSMDTDPDLSLVELHCEKLVEAKGTLAGIHNELLALDLEDSDELFVRHSKLERLQFDCAHKAKKLLATSAPDASATSSTVGKGMKLPKLDVPSFDGDILNWSQFWEQFSVSVHSRKDLCDAEKLVYLQQAIKKGSARSTIEGLSHTADNYIEAVTCLKSRFDCPRLIYRTHVQRIMDAPSLKDGSGKELRRLHDTILQHIRALKCMEGELTGALVTSIIELKLDSDTMFEWQKHTQDKKSIPQYEDLLSFIDLRVQASETATSATSKRQVRISQASGVRAHSTGRNVASFATHTDSKSRCILCKTECHPLYACPKFKDMAHAEKLSVLKDKSLCRNCLGSGHFARQCKSLHKCKKCQRPHHTLLHSDHDEGDESGVPVSSNGAVRLRSSKLLTTCRVLVTAPNGSSMVARALLDNASSASFVTQRFAQSLSLPLSRQTVHVSGIADVSPNGPAQSIASLEISPTSGGDKTTLSAVVVPKVTCDLPLSPVPLSTRWKHLSDLTLADPDFGIPGRIDLLLGVEVFVDALLNDRRTEPPGSPVALETKFGWVFSGGIGPRDPISLHVAYLHTSTSSGDDLLRCFWEIEQGPLAPLALSPEEKYVVQHYEDNHSRTSSGRFVVPLPRKPDAATIGESRSQAVRRFLALERSLHSRKEFQAFDAVMKDYLDKEHAEPVPENDLGKPPQEVFYLPMHAIRKESSTTTKLRAVFDASAKSSTGVSLNDTLLVGPTVHPPLVDVLLRFRRHRIALTTDVSQMYRAVQLIEQDRDFHRFVWRSSPEEDLQDYRMTRLTFGVSASSFAANMSVRQNAIQLALKFPEALKVVKTSFYVDDGLTGADTIAEAITLQQKLQSAFERGGFLLRKWNSSDKTVLEQIPPDLRDARPTHEISEFGCSTKALGLEWNVAHDHFNLTVVEWPLSDTVTKRMLSSDIAKTFDVLGWFAPTIISMKILLQRLWELKLDWDDPVPKEIYDAWYTWKSEIPSLAARNIPRCYFPTTIREESIQLHGFSDASENAYSGVVYARATDTYGTVHISLVIAKTRVAPIKRLSIPRLELCGVQLLAELLHHVRTVFDLPLSEVFAWTDSTIVLSWLGGNPRRFKTYVGNRVSSIIDCIPSSRWNHVVGVENPADCASRGVSPRELLEHPLWWEGPLWLRLAPSEWPTQDHTLAEVIPDEERELCLVTTAVLTKEPIMALTRCSNFSHLRRVTAWVLRFISNCRVTGEPVRTCLTVSELTAAESYWILSSQADCFSEEIAALKANRPLPEDSNLVAFRPFLDSSGVLRVGGRASHSMMSFGRIHPIILHGKHALTKLIVRTEHLRLLHAGPALLSASLGQRYHIVQLRKTVRSLTRQCTTRRRHASKPVPQMMGQLPMERTTPGCVFECVGVDYAGPFLIKSRKTRKPTITKSYACIFVSLSVKAVHIELVSDLTSAAFLATLRRFTARRGLPTLIWSDHGSNFVGAKRELKELYQFLEQDETQGIFSDFCTSRNIEWRFIPEHGPHFGDLWEAAVRSVKKHLRCCVGESKLTFEELTTVLSQVEACLNSRPLIPVPSADDDGLEVLTPGHFLIGHALTTLPNPSFRHRPVSLLRRWQLCQDIVRRFWQIWSSEYVPILNRFNKWRYPTRNLSVGDVVLLKEDVAIPTNWPLGRVTRIHPGTDKLVHVATVRTSKGTYKRPVTKIAVLVPHDGAES